MTLLYQHYTRLDCYVLDKIAIKDCSFFTAQTVISKCYTTHSLPHCNLRPFHTHRGKDTVENQAKHLLYLLEERDSSDFTRFVRVLLSSSEKCKEIGQLLSKESGVMDDEKYGR